MAKSKTATPVERLLSFAVAAKPFSIPAQAVLEVRRVPAMTRVPYAPPALAGLINHQGVAISVVRMSSLLGVESGESRDARVIVYGDSPPIGLLVDEVIGLGAATGGARKAKQLDLGELLAREFVVSPVQKTRTGFVETRAEAPSAEVDVPLLAFRVSDQRYALPLGSVLELFGLPDAVTALPRSARAALGMTGYRDGMLPLFSLAALLGLDDMAGRHYVLVTRLNGAAVGLVAGMVEGVLRVPETAIEDVPAILRRGEGEAEIESIARVGDDRALVSILSPTRLFRNREIEQALEESKAGTSSMPEPVEAQAMVQFVVFRLGEETYGLPIDAVDEIIGMPETLTRLPGAPAFVAGVINLRGRALPLIDQRQRFGSVSGGARARVIVVTMNGMQTGFIVDSVSEILRVAASDVAAAPLMPGDGAKVFDRVISTADAMVLIVDPKELLDRAERDLLRAFDPAAGRASVP